MNVKKFFALAKEKGIEESQIQISRSSSFSVSLFHKEIDRYKVSSSQSVTACGIYKGKFGSASTEKLDASAFEYLVNQIILTATFSEVEDNPGIFPGSEKYKKHNVFNPDLASIPAEKKIAVLHEVEDAVLAYDPRIVEADNVTYAERESESGFYNSFGLKLHQKTNYFYFVAGAVAKDGEETKTFYDVFIDNDFSKFDPKAFVASICKKTLSKFGGAPCASKKYPTILSQDIAASLVNYFLQSAVADEVQRHSSLFEGKLGQRVASSKVTIAEKPLVRNLNFYYFDDEGVAAQNKVIVKNGILQGYFYNRETAKKDGVQSTGNGVWGGSKISTGFSNVFVKPGKKSFEEMIAPIQEGVYITEIAGLGTGMNSVSGDFSCQAEGYMIRDGKIAEPLNLITLSGNLLAMFKDVKELDAEAKLTDMGITVSNIYVKRLSIGGK